MHRPSKQDAERGQALVEFALTVPIFLMLVFGIIDLARLVFSYTQVIDAARQGVRYGIVEGLDVGNYQFLDCNGIESAVRDTPGLVPGSDMGVTITYRNLQDNSVKIAGCDGNPSPPSLNVLKDGAVLSVKVDGSIAPITPILAIFSNSIHFDYTAKRAIAESAAFTDKWPTAPPQATNFRTSQNCSIGRVYFYWDPITFWPDQIQIRNSFTNQTVVTINKPETQYAFCKDDDPYDGRVCGANIDVNGGYGMWYMVVIQDGIEGSSSLDATASCKAGGGGGGTGSGEVYFSGKVVYNKNTCGSTGNRPRLANQTITLLSAGPNLTLYDDDDVTQTVTTDVNGEFSLTGTIPDGELVEHFRLSVSPSATYYNYCTDTYNFDNMQDGDSASVTFVLGDR
jgi:hypothetical protein